MGKIFYKGVDYSSPTSSGVSGVKGNKETVYRVGNVNLTPENLGALAENGDSKENTVTFTSADATTADAWTDVAVLATGEKHSSIFSKISTMFKNIRYIYTHFIKSENILDTLGEIVANTQSGKVAGALAVKELNRNLTKTKIQVAAQAENITVDANSSRDYKFSNFSQHTNIIAQIPVVASNGLGITVGRNADKDFTVRLWNNTSLSKDVSIIYYVLYNSN